MTKALKCVAVLWGILGACVWLPMAAQASTDLSRLSVEGVQLIYQAAEGKPCCGQVSALAELKNASDLRVSDLVVEARFLDASGKLMDASTEALYGVSIAPNEKAAVRVDTRAMRPPSSYASAEMRVVDASMVRPEPLDSRHNVAWNLLVSWGPMALLLAVWLWIARRYSVGYQKRYAELIEEQNQLLKRQVAALEAWTASAAKKD